MLSATTKKTVDFLVPCAAAAVVAYILYRRKTDWKFMLIGCGIAFLLVYIATSKITKAAFLQQPALVPTGGGCNDYDPTALMTSYYNNFTCTWCQWDKDLLNSIAALADCQLITCYNYWNQKYFTDQGVSLAGAIAKGGHFWDASYNNIASALTDRFTRLNLQ